MSLRLRNTPRSVLFILISLLLFLVFAVSCIFTGFACYSIKKGLPFRIFSLCPVVVSQSIAVNEADFSDFESGELLLVKSQSDSPQPLPVTTKGGQLFVAEKTDAGYCVLKTAEPFAAEESGILLRLPFLGGLVSALFVGNRPIFFLMLTVAVTATLEVFFCMTLLRKKHALSDKADKAEEDISIIEKYSALDYNPFPQKRYSSPVETVEIEDDSRLIKKDVTLKVGQLPEQHFSLDHNAEVTVEHEGCSVTLIIHSL